MGKRNRTRRAARRPAFKEVKPVILVVTEGAVTDPEYFRGLSRWARNPLVRIEVVGGAGVPRTIIQFAKSRRRDAEKRARRENDDNLRYDTVWCVFDVDDHPNIADATQMAFDNGLECAISNPCFELWLWLHLGEQPGMRHRHELSNLIKTCLPYYDKHVNFEDFAQGYHDAVKRAARLAADAEADDEPYRNPTTGVYRLTERIHSQL